VEVVVLDVDPASRRIRLSAKAVLAAHEAAEMREYTDRNDAAAPEGFGSLADKLRGALKPRD
jgi:ribosomal protein S1